MHSKQHAVKLNFSLYIGVIFQEFLTDFIMEMRNKGQHVLLLLDNASSYTQPPPLSNTEVKFLPLNITAHIQPMDGEIISRLTIVSTSQIILCIVWMKAKD